MTATLLQEKFDASGNLIEVVWETAVLNSGEMLANLKAAIHRMSGPLVFSASAAPSKAYPIAEGGRQSMFSLITEGAAGKCLARYGAPVKLSPKQAILLGTMLEAQGRVYSADEFVELLYPSPDRQASTALNAVYRTMSDLRKMFPDLIDPKRYVIRAAA